MRSVPVLAVAALVAACGTAADRVVAPTPAGEAAADLQGSPGVAVPGILIGLDSNPVTVGRGTSATVPLRVSRVAGFTGAVTLSADTAGVARGVRVSLSRASVPAGDTAVTNVTVTVDSGATATTTPTSVRITATGANVSTQTIVLSINVVNVVPGFTFAFVGATPGSTVQAGQSGTVRVVVRRAGGFTGPVTFAADTLGLPRGVTITQGATSGDTVTLNIAATQTTAPGSFTFNLRGTGTGVTAQTLAFPLTVSPVGSFTVATGAPAFSAAPGQTVIVPVRITRQGGFTGTIGFQATGLPTGVTATFDTTGMTATDSIVTLRLTVPATLATGAYPITISGTSPGLTAQTASVTINVPAPGFTIGAPAAPLIILAGAGNAIQLPIVRQSGFTDSVAFAVTGAPAGLTAQATAIRSGSGNTSSTINLTAEGGLAAGTYPITITATSTSGVQQVITTNVTVVANNPSFGFQFQLPQTTVTVPAGGSATATVNVQRIASLAPYAVVVVQNASRGITVTMDSDRTTGGAVTLTVAAAADVPPGRYALTITGATPFGPIPSVTMIVQVTAPATTP